MRVRIGFEEKDPRILPEMGVRVSFLDGEKETLSPRPALSAVVVPREAVRIEGSRGVVFVVYEDRVEQREVTLGGASSEGQVVLSDLAAGARVVVGDVAGLVDGARVRIASEE